MEDICENVFCVIAKYLTIDDFIQLQLTCKHFREVLTKNRTEIFKNRTYRKPHGTTVYANASCIKIQHYRDGLKHTPDDKVNVCVTRHFDHYDRSNRIYYTVHCYTHKNGKLHRRVDGQVPCEVKFTLVNDVNLTQFMNNLNDAYSCWCEFSWQNHEKHRTPQYNEMRYYTAMKILYLRGRVENIDYGFNETPVDSPNDEKCAKHWQYYYTKLVEALKSDELKWWFREYEGQ